MDRELEVIARTLERADLSDVAAARRSLAAVVADRPASLSGVDVFEATVAGAGGDVPVRVYRPRDPAAAGVLLFMHGGAFVLGGLDTEHTRCLAYSAAAACTVVSVDYRLAPENPYPAGLDDCITVARWLAGGGAASLGADPARIAVGGASAGGGLAACVALHERDTVGCPFVFQLLVYPVIDDRVATPSMARFRQLAPWDGEASALMWRLYLGERRSEPVSCYAAAGRAEDLGGLPATYVTTTEIDPLRDEGLDYARRLVAAGVEVEIHHLPGTFHGFDVHAPDAAVTRRALREQAGALRRVIGPVD